MITEWIMASSNYGMNDILNRTIGVSGVESSDISYDILGLRSSGTTVSTVPYKFDYPYSFKLSEHHLYGSSRLGIMKAEAYVTDQDDKNKSKHESGNTLYELSDHLGNVRTVISDRRIKKSPSDGDEADVITQSDYYP